MLKSEDALQLQQVSCCFVVKLLLRFCLEWGRQFENKNLTVYLHMHVYTKQFGKIENTELNIPYMYVYMQENENKCDHHRIFHSEFVSFSCCEWI